MVGLLVLAIVAAYCGLVGWLVTSVVKNNWGRTGIVVIALAIPFWDLPLGYSNYANHCLTQGGIRVRHSFPAQRSIYFSTPTGFQPELLMKMGFEVVEYRNFKDGSIDRFSRSKSGSLEKVQAAAPDSLLQLRLMNNEALSWNLYRQQRLLEDSRGGGLIAVATEFVWAGGWIQNLLPLGPIAICHSESLHDIVVLASKGSSQPDQPK